MKQILFFLLCCHTDFCHAQNKVGIGTNNPQSMLHVNGDFRLQNGGAVNTISSDSTFSNPSDNVLPTQRAVRNYLKSGQWLYSDTYPAPAANVPIFITDTSTNLDEPVCVFVQGSYVYVASNGNDRLCIFDISNPRTLIPKGTIPVPGPTSVFVQGNYAYVTSSGKGISIFDVSNPSSIRVIFDHYTGLSGMQSVFVKNNLAYAVSSSQHKFSILDVSDTLNIRLLSTTSNSGSGLQQVYVQGNYAYTVSPGDNRLYIYNVQDPYFPFLTDLMVNQPINLYSPRSVFVKGGYAYIASYGSGRLYILDVSNPYNVVVSGNIVFNDNIQPNLNRPVSVTVQGNYAFVVSQSGKQLRMFDVRNPANIVAKGLITTNGYDPQSVFVQGNYAYVTGYDNHSGTISKYDIQGNTPLLTVGPDGSFQSIGFDIPPYSSCVNTTSAQAIGGIKTFLSFIKAPYFLGDGSMLNNVVNTLGVQTVGGAKTFTDRATVSITSTTASPTLTLYDNATANGYSRLQFGNAGTNKYWHTAAHAEAGSDANSRYNIFYSNGTVGTDILSISGNGNATLSGALSQNSDARLKTGIRPISHAMQSLMLLNGYHYYWKAKDRDTSQQTGVLAQEVQKVFPELVSQDGNKTLSVNYNGLIPYLIEAVKTQQQQIEKMNQDNTAILVRMQRDKEQLSVALQKVQAKLQALVQAMGGN